MGNSEVSKRKVCLAIILLALVTLLGLFLAYAAFAQPYATVSGLVVDEAGQPVPRARVRIQATSPYTLTAADGSFVLDGLSPGVTVTVSAWKDAYYCAKQEGVVPPAGGITLTLRLYQTNDNPDYDWIPPTGTDSCASCKPAVTGLWLENDQHARAGTNPRFFSLYNGSDLSGTVVISPGYELDFPGTAGNCAACHAPGTAVDAPFTTNMNALVGVDRDFGVHCDFCHKVADVYLNPATGQPYPNAPGVMSMDVRRPFPGPRYQLFFGTFDDDNVPEEDTYLPLIEQSQFCAPCHQFSFWGTPIYQSFREWQESRYRQEGIECQVCHTPAPSVYRGQVLTNVAPGMGGVERDPLKIHAHTMPGAADENLLRNTVTMTLDARQVGGSIQATVAITNTGAGHHVPTDHPGRHMILAVTATAALGQPLPQLGGPTVPDWGGAQAGLPGQAFAKVLQDVQTGAKPVVSYWKQALIVGDNRIPADGVDRSVYIFAAPAATGPVTVTAELRFRRLFQAEMDARGWPTPDIVMEWAQVAMPLQPWGKAFLPLVMRE
jgi:hypothetical protein